MYTISRRYRKPKGRPSKKRFAAIKKAQKRWAVFREKKMQMNEGKDNSTDNEVINTTDIASCAFPQTSVSEKKLNVDIVSRRSCKAKEKPSEKKLTAIRIIKKRGLAVSKVKEEMDKNDNKDSSMDNELINTPESASSAVPQRSTRGKKN